MKDYLVTITVPIIVRIENADDERQAVSIAEDYWFESNAANLIEDALDPTPFYPNDPYEDWTADWDAEEDNA